MTAHIPLTRPSIDAAGQPASGDAPTGRGAGRGGGVAGALQDGVLLILAIYAMPLVIVALGAPFVLLIRLMTRLIRGVGIP